jgi:hypothetical protein
MDRFQQRRFGLRAQVRRRRQGLRGCKESIFCRPGVGDEPAGEMDIEALQEIVEITAPRNGHDDVADRVFEDQGPADDPGDELAKRDIGIGIGASGDRNAAGKFGVAHGREAAGNSREDEQQRNPRPSVISRHTDGGKDTRSYYGRDTHKGQVFDRQHFSEPATMAVGHAVRRILHNLVQ